MNLGLVATVAAMVGISPNSARRVALSAAHRYKVFNIRKRNGGLRLIAQPAREVKALQRALVECLSKSLRVHDAATAYKEGSSIRLNAELHMRARYLLKLDFEGFFSSIDENALRTHITKWCSSELTLSEIEFILKLVLWREPDTGRRALCIGAPSSPFLANSVMYDVDTAIIERCLECHAVYSRYSDDITLSAEGPEVLVRAEREVREVIKNAPYPALRFNDSKRISVSRSTAMTVTGLTLTNQGPVSVGRVRKRGVRAGVDRFVKGELDDDGIRRLRGEIAFVLSVEPQFRRTLLKTYGRRCQEVLPKGK